MKAFFIFFMFFMFFISFMPFMSDPIALACPVCFQVDDNATTHGLRSAVIVLLAVTSSVLTGCGVFVARFLRSDRAAAAADARRQP